MNDEVIRIEEETPSHIGTEANSTDNKVVDNPKKKYKKQAKLEAKNYLKEKRACKGETEKKEFNTRWKEKKKVWKKGLRKLPKEERKAQKFGYKFFKKRKKRAKRITAWAIVLAILCLAGYLLQPMLSMTFEVLSTQQEYTTRGESVEKARAAGRELSAQICDEGFILLKNDEGFLPLKEKKLCVFGDDAYGFVYGGSGSAGASQADAVSLFDALKANGIEYCESLDSAYAMTAKGADGGLWPTIKNFFLESDDSSDWKEISNEEISRAKEYSSTALIVLSSQEVEGAEIDISLLQPMKADSKKKELIQNVCEEFEHVILVINSGNVMELGWTNDYDSIDAIIWVGSPGQYGCVELAKMLTGEINPSGRTVDTWPVSIEKEPSYITYGNNEYSNLNLHYFTYNEGIYVGYRYYETRFGEDAKAYAQNVVYPFGYGLSYTSFEQSIISWSNDGENIKVGIKVSNTGEVEGKEVVQLYFMAPYTEGGIEKSAIELAAFAKTDEIQPGASKYISLSFPVRDMSSYSTERGCYILEKGEYKITIGSNVHDALLSDDVRTYVVNEDILYDTDETTGETITNQFSFAEGDVIYLSRADWEGTFPVPATTLKAGDEVISAKKAYEETTPASGEQPITGKDNGIMLTSLKGKPYDDALWDEFLDQFTVEEMIGLTANGGWHTQSIERLGVPATHLLDGPSGINSMYSSVNAVAYPMETVISSSWNTDIAAQLGYVIGDEAKAYGVDGWYAPAMNIHRLSIGGRNNEYYSEDPLLSGKMASATIKAVQSKGVIAFMKHFVCNDVELNARSDVSVWVNEQSLREIYLKPFEMSVKEGGAAGAMSSFSRLGVKWCGGSSELLNNVLRTEWGFEGVVTTDAALGAWMYSPIAVQNGNDLMLEMGLQTSAARLEKAVEADPVGTIQGLRDSTHNICYAIVNYVS